MGDKINKKSVRVMEEIIKIFLMKSKKVRCMDFMTMKALDELFWDKYKISLILIYYQTIEL